MKKHYIFTKSLLVLASATTLTTSCLSDLEEPLIEANNIESELQSTDSSGDENFRKSGEFNYSEKFSNVITPAPGYDGEGNYLGFFLPGTGVGNSIFIGKAFSFINQMPLSETESIGAPVTIFYENELSELGITDIPDNVSSVTVDKKGNAVFFSSGLNTAVKINESRIEFSVPVSIVGGRGGFEGVSGEGKVSGFYNPATGEGETVLTATIVF